MSPFQAMNKLKRISDISNSFLIRNLNGEAKCIVVRYDDMEFIIDQPDGDINTVSVSDPGQTYEPYRYPFATMGECMSFVCEMCLGAHLRRTL